MTDTDIRPAPLARLKRYISFAVSGGTGFVVDISVLNLFAFGFGLDPYLSRVIAIGVAMMVTWQINRHVTFRDQVKRGSARDLAAEGGRYVVVAVVAAAVNWAIYAATIWTVPVAAPQLARLIGEGLPSFGAFVGSGIAMIVSYLGYSRFAFRPH